MLGRSALLAATSRYGQSILNLDAGNNISYPGTGSSWFDLSSYANTAALQNTPAWTSDNGGSLIFNGSSQRGYIPNNSLFDLSKGNYALEAWFNAKTFATGQSIIAKDKQGNSFDWCMSVNSSTAISIYSNGTATNVIATVPAMSIDTWYHAVISSIGSTIFIYLNSVLYITKAMTTSSHPNYVSDVYIASTNVGNYFNGKISIVNVYKKGLYGGDVSQNFNALRGRYGI